MSCDCIGRVVCVFSIVWNEQTSAPTPANLTWGVREREVVREGSWGCWVLWMNPGLSQAQDVECGLYRKSRNEVCFVDSWLTIPQTHWERRRCSRRSRDGAQVSRIALSSACDVRSRLRDNRNGLETHDKGEKKEDRKGECAKGREKWYLSIN